MNYELIRLFILATGWPILIAGGIFIIVKASKFYYKTEKLALGRLIIVESISTLVSMFCLGVVATVFMMLDVKYGVIIVTPIFVIWFIVMVITFLVSNKWRDEAAKINILYYKMKEKTTELEQEKSKLTHVAQNMSTGAILFDSEGRIMFINREAKNIIGFESDNPNEILGALYGKFSEYKLKDYIQNCINGTPSNIIGAEIEGRIYNIFFRNLTDSREESSGNFGHFAWIRDVTEEKMLENSKDKFITVASHKLRTPLTGIRTFLSLLSDDLLTDKQRHYIEDIQKCSDNMLQVINQLLISTETEKLNISVNLKIADIIALISQNIEQAKNQLDGKDCEIIFTPIDKTKNISVDTDLFSQVFETVINNAIIYSQYNSTEKIPSVKIGIEFKDELCIVSVADRGIGIPQKEQTKIFTKFFRAENALIHHTEGTGINLNVAKKITESMKGSIRFESEENVGSTFFISIPVK